MSSVRTIAAVLALVLASSVPAAAKEGGRFLVRLGRDTTSFESYTREANHIEVDQVGRSPRVRLRHFVYDFDAKGALTHATMTVRAPGAAADAPPLQVVNVSFEGDSLAMVADAGGKSTRSKYGVAPGAMVLALSSPWVIYEEMSLRLARQKADTVGTPMYIIGAAGPDWLSVRRLGRDSVAVLDGHGSVFHASVDKAGHFLAVRPIAGTGKFSVERLPDLDISALTAGFTAREQQGAVMGMLSPRDTARAGNAGGASMWIDYGRPSMRGRPVFGGIVPWGEVWRTGANAATQFKTDRALVFGSVEVPAGFYSLWSVATPAGWKLIVNSETGQWGTEHKPALDVYSIDLAVSALPQPVEQFVIGITPSANGGAITFDWETRRGTATFVTKP